MSERRKKGSHHRRHGHRQRTDDDEDRYTQDNQGERRDGIVDQQSYLPQTTASYPPQGLASYSQQGAPSYLPRVSTSYQASGTASFTSQGTASHLQSGISSYTSQGTGPYTPQETAFHQQEVATSYLQPDETSHLGTWAPETASDSYPPLLTVRSEEEPARHDQEKSGHYRDHRSRPRDPQGRDRRPSVADREVVDQYISPTGYATYPQQEQYNDGNDAGSMGMTRVRRGSAAARTSAQDNSSGEPSSNRIPASHSGDFPSNDRSLSGLSSQFRRVSLSSDGYMGPMTDQSTPQSSYVGSPDGNFSEVYWASPPTTLPRTSSRRNSIVPHGESAGLHRRRRSSETSGSYHRRDSTQSGLLPSPGSGTRRTATFPIFEDSPLGRDEDSHTSQHGTDGESRVTRLTDRRDSSVSFTHESNYTGQDKEEQKHQKASTYEYVDQLRKTNRWNNQGDPRGPWDGDDGSGGYGNNSSYRV